MTENFKEGLIEAIKVAGQMIIDSAEDIAGKTELMSYLDISVNFDPENRYIPELAIYRTHVPSYEQLEHILDTFDGTSNIVEVDTISCQYCGRYNKNHSDLKYYALPDDGYVCEDCKDKTNQILRPTKEKKS